MSSRMRSKVTKNSVQISIQMKPVKPVVRRPFRTLEGLMDHLGSESHLYPHRVRVGNASIRDSKNLYGIIELRTKGDPTGNPGKLVWTIRAECQDQQGLPNWQIVSVQHNEDVDAFLHDHRMIAKDDLDVWVWELTPRQIELLRAYGSGQLLSINPFSSVSTRTELERKQLIRMGLNGRVQVTERGLLVLEELNRQ